MTDDEKIIELLQINWQEEKQLTIPVFNFPTGHITMSGIVGENNKYLVTFNYWDEFHEPGTEALINHDKATPRIGVVFDNIDSIRAVATNLLYSANKFEKINKNID